MMIGCHLSINNGYIEMIKNAELINANTFQIFIRNPYNLYKKEINNNILIKHLLSKYPTFLVHSPYSINLCSNKNSIIELSKKIIISDLNYINNYFPKNKVMYNIHPGNHMGQGINFGIKKISDSINEILSEQNNIVLLLETMSGKGTEIGSKIEELSNIIDLVDNKEVGICLDTCHIYSSGYDIVNKFNEVFDNINSIISINKIKSIHLNDSFEKIGSKKDRHEKIGMGYIGIKPLINIAKYFKDIPLILETPNDINGYKKEIQLLINNI